MRTIRYFFTLILIPIILLGCASQKKDAAILTDAALLHRNVEQLRDVLIQDMFSPPVSSRIFSYTSLAAYEALKYEKSNHPSITAQLNGFTEMPKPESGKEYNYLVAATKAFFTVAEKITFSKDSLIEYQNTVYPQFEALLDEETYNRSVAFGEAIGKTILERTTKDMYKETRGMPKFIGSDEQGRWRPTPPDYSDAAEPYWGKIKPLLLDSASQIVCPPPPIYSEDTTSAFFKTVKEVYTITTTLTEEQKTIARYWDDNPFVTEHFGHMMYGNKKITPVAHWIGITAIACKQEKADAFRSAQAYALTSIAMHEVIITCWDQKYKYNQIRPITAINELIDRNWQPFLQTPPFPEHSSGHSGISASAATVLTKLFGDNVAFEDTSDLPFIGMKRNFKSFNAAALEASLSRVYGGIHYRTGVDAGAVQGQRVGDLVLQRLAGNEAVVAK